MKSSKGRDGKLRPPKGPGDFSRGRRRETGVAGDRVAALVYNSTLMHAPPVLRRTTLSKLLVRTLAITILALSILAPASAEAQDPGQAYLQAVSEHFHVSLDEVRVLAGWGRPAAEIPVVLFLAGKGGVSPDAVMALRNAGRGWSAIASRWQLHAGQFHVALDPSVDAGLLSGVYEQFRARPGSAWPSIELADQDVVALVHLRFLSEYLSVPPARVIVALGRVGPGPAALQALRRGN